MRAAEPVDAEPAASLSSLASFAEQHFAADICERVRLLTGHSSKGETFNTVYIIQPSMMPLDRAVTEGGIALAQEPFVEYVMLTRATETLLYLKDVDTGPDGDMGEVLFGTF